MSPLRILGVVGARPNYMKMAPIHRVLRERGIECHWVHTGQHYDEALSDRILADLELPPPDTQLGVGSASHAVQTARILERIEPVMRSWTPDLVLVAGDVNSTLAGALAAVKLGICVAHVEAGLRSRDRTMPEELNRVVTDSVADLLFTTSEEAGDNLEAEGRPRASIHFAGNPMIDTLRRFESRAAASDAPSRLGVEAKRYLLVTIHRPSNVDRAEDLRRVLDLLARAGEQLPVVAPLHPRTRRRLEDHGLWTEAEALPRIRFLPALGYLDFLALMRSARVVLTDSGGVQEETTALGVPCLTLRPNTERPVTQTHGTNLVVSERTEDHLRVLETLEQREREVAGRLPDLWDGHAAERIVDRIQSWDLAGRPSEVRPHR